MRTLTRTLESSPKHCGEADEWQGSQAEPQCPAPGMPPESSSQLLQSLHFRPIQPQDRQQIQALHEQWFPVRYHDEFYDSLVYGRLTTVARSSKNRKQDSKHAKAAVGAPPSSQKRASDQHFSLARKDRRRPESHVAIESDEENNLLPECSDLERSSDAWSEDRDILVDDSPSTMPRGRALFTYLAIQRGRQGQLDDPDLSTSSGMNNNVTTALSPQPNPDQPHTTDRIVACIVGAFLEAHCLPLDLRNLLAPNPERHPLLFYIMTLGTADDYRNRGLATRLVQECIRLQVLPNPECGTLYLHVLDTNQAAIRFYENLGFHRVKLIANYYNIDGQSRDCYLYASYFHGNRGHLSLLMLLRQGLQSWWRTLRSTLLSWSSFRDDDNSTHGSSIDPSRKKASSSSSSNHNNNTSKVTSPVQSMTLSSHSKTS